MYKMNKNKKLSVLSAVVASLIMPAVSLAIDFPGQPSQLYIGLPVVMNSILNVVWWVFLAIIIVSFIIIGVIFLNSKGDPKELQDARQGLIWATVGVVVGILAFSIINIVRIT